MVENVGRGEGGRACGRRSGRESLARTPERLRMGGAMEQLMLVVHHVFVSECALLLQSRVKNKIDMVLTGLHRPVRRRAVGYSAMDRCN